MDYELRIPIETPGADKISAIVASVKDLAGATKLSAAELALFEKLLRSMTASGQTTDQVLKDIAGSTKSLGPVAGAAAQYLQAMDGASQKLGNTLKTHTVPAVAAASAAILAFEGKLSVTAVEQFLANTLKMGSVLQGIFPIFGAIATVEVLGTMVSRLGEVAAGWDPLLKAEKEAVDSVKELSREYEKLKSTERELYLARAQREGGTEGRRRAEAGLGAAEANLTGERAADYRALIDKKQKELDTFNQRQQVAAASGEEVGVLEFRQAAGLQREIATLTQQLLVAQSTQNAQAGIVGEKELEAKEAALKQRLQSAKALESILTHVDDLYKRSTEAEYTGLEKINKQRQAEIELLEKKIHLTDKAGKDYEVSKSSVLRGAGLYDSTVGKINDSFDALERKETGKYFVPNGDGTVALSAAVLKLIRKNFEDTAKELEKESGRDDKYNARGFQQALRKTIQGQESDQRHSERAIQYYERSSIDTVNREANSALRVSQLTAGPGQQFAAVEAAYRIRLDLARQIYDIEAARADRVLTGAEKEEALAKAYYETRKSEEDALQEKRIRYLELRKHAEDQYASAVQGAFRALVAGGEGGMGAFFKSQALGLGEQVVGNVARKTFQEGGSPLGKLGSALPSWLVGGTILDPQMGQMKAADIQLKAANLQLAAAGGRGGSVFTPLGVPSALADLMGTVAGIGAYGAPTAARSSAFGRSSLSSSRVVGYDETGAAQYASVSSLPFTTGAKVAMSGAAVVAGGLGIYSGIKEGGIGGALTATGSAAGMASTLMAISGVGGPVGIGIAAGIAAGSALAHALLPDRRKQYREQQSSMLEGSRFSTPYGQDYTFNDSGDYLASSLGGGMRPTTIVVQVDAIDSKSIVERSQDISDAVMRGIQQGHGGLIEEVKGIKG